MTRSLLNYSPQCYSRWKLCNYQQLTMAQQYVIQCPTPIHTYLNNFDMIFLTRYIHSHIPTQRLITTHYIWPNFNRDVRRWAHTHVYSAKDPKYSNTSSPFCTLSPHSMSDSTKFMLTQLVDSLAEEATKRWAIAKIKFLWISIKKRPWSPWSPLLRHLWVHSCFTRFCMHFYLP